MRKLQLKSLNTVTISIAVNKKKKNIRKLLFKLQKKMPHLSMIDIDEIHFFSCLSFHFVFLHFLIENSFHFCVYFDSIFIFSYLFFRWQKYYTSISAYLFKTIILAKKIFSLNRKCSKFELIWKFHWFKFFFLHFVKRKFFNENLLKMVIILRIYH